MMNMAAAVVVFMVEAREVVVVGVNLLRHLNHKWEGGCWQVKPPTRISSEGGRMWARIFSVT
jgi:hypothetical protein